MPTAEKFPTEEDKRLYYEARLRPQRVDVWRRFRTLTDMVDEIIAQMRAAYRHGQSRFEVGTYCMVSRLTDVPHEIAHIVDLFPDGELSYTDRYEVSQELTYRINYLLKQRIDSSEVFIYTSEGLCDYGEMYKYSAVLRLQHFGSSDRREQELKSTPLVP